jgi:glycerophosphoryl diester phosphodiesterase
MPLSQVSGPLVYAHRGASAYAPENTLAAFRVALKQGADGIELDAKLSADGVVVVMHDPTVDRTTDGTGLISRLTVSELKRLDAGSCFSPEFKDETIPTLEEVFEAVGGKLLINIELTNYASPLDALPIRVAHLIMKLHLNDKVMVSSFHPLNLIRFHRLMPEVPAGLLTQPGRAGKWARSGLGKLFPHDALHPYYSDVDAKLVETNHQHKKKVNVWTVDLFDEICRLKTLAVDGIITDDPIMAKKAMD